MITTSFVKPCDGMSFRTVSFQGSQLTHGDRLRIKQRAQVQVCFLNSVLAQQVEQTVSELDLRKKQGIKPERIWFIETNATGTPFVGDAFGFGHS